MGSVTRLREAAGSNDRAERTMGLAAVLSGVLTEAGSRPVLVGGGAVEIYTRSAYTTRDLDFVAAMTESASKAMAGLGFDRDGRHWIHEELGIVVEFPGTTLAPAEAISIDVDGIELRIIAVEDLVVDRLASWKHWGWDPDGAAAVILLALHQDLDQERLRKRAIDEHVADALESLRPLAGSDEPISEDELRRLRASLKGSGEGVTSERAPTRT